MIDEVFRQFLLIFGRKYKSRFSSDVEVKATKRMYEKAFVRHCIDWSQVDYALDFLVDHPPEWPPELPDFLKILNRPEATGLASFEQVRDEIYAKYRDTFNSEDQQTFVFSSRFIEYIYEGIGKNTIQTFSAQETESAIRAGIKKATKLIKAGVLPPKRQALTAPNNQASTPISRKELSKRVQATLKSLRGKA